MARSPIETRMIEALREGAEANGVSLCDFTNSSARFVHREDCYGPSFSVRRLSVVRPTNAPSGRVVSHGPRGVDMFSDVSISSYRIDIVIRNIDDLDGGLIAIECDGFDYHERTKQQAAYDRARDRELLCLGIQVIRFLGSEIHHSPERCASEAYAALAAMGRRSGEHAQLWWLKGHDIALKQTGAWPGIAPEEHY